MKNDDFEHCQCKYCIGGDIHDSDCAVHNEPAYKNGPCDCSLQKRTVPQEMVDRFLSWPLPKGFSPDCGVSFDGRGKDARGYEKQWPVGTNLLSADQAREMLEHVVAPTLRYERLLLSNAEKEIATLSASQPDDCVAVQVNAEQMPATTTLVTNTYPVTTKDLMQHSAPQSEQTHVSVPRVPTEQMLHDGLKAAHNEISLPSLRLLWSAMLRAATGKESE